jgi:hypothetical protein
LKWLVIRETLSPGDPRITNHPSLSTIPWEKTSMRRLCLGIAGVVLASTLAGCGEPAVQETSAEKTDVTGPGFDAMKNDMLKGMQTKSYQKKAAAPKEKTP